MRVFPFERMVFKAEGYCYFGYPELPYEEGLNNIVAAIDTLTPYKEYTIEELEPVLLKLNIDPFTLTFFRKIKHMLIQNGVMLCPTFGEESWLGIYGEFKINSNSVIINLASLIMDGKVERPEQVAQVIVHELVHSLVGYKTLKLLNPDAFPTRKPLSDADKTAIMNLEIIFNHICKYPLIYEEYGLNDLNEMIAELVNPTFVGKFKQININCLKLQTSPDKRQIFTTMYRFLVHLFSGKSLYVNAHDAALENFDVLVKTNSRPQIEFYNENLLPHFKSRTVEPYLDCQGLNKVLNREDAFRFRAYDFPLLIKERDLETRYDRYISSRVRNNRMQIPEAYI
jgi:hypothetical protein